MRIYGEADYGFQGETIKCPTQSGACRIIASSYNYVFSNAYITAVGNAPAMHLSGFGGTKPFEGATIDGRLATILYLYGSGAFLYDGAIAYCPRDGTRTQYVI